MLHHKYKYLIRGRDEREGEGSIPIQNHQESSRFKMRAHVCEPHDVSEQDGDLFVLLSHDRLIVVVAVAAVGL